MNYSILFLTLSHTATNKFLVDFYIPFVWFEQPFKNATTHTHTHQSQPIATHRNPSHRIHHPYPPSTNGNKTNACEIYQEELVQKENRRTSSDAFICANFICVLFFSEWVTMLVWVRVDRKYLFFFLYFCQCSDY